MIKHKWRPALAGLLLLTLTGLLVGATWEKHPYDKDLTFQFRNSTRSNQTRDSGSVTMKNDHATTSDLDTTESVDMRAAHYRGPYGIWGRLQERTLAGGGWDVGDTMLAFQIRVFNPNGGAVTGLDSVLVSVQVSPDNLNWTTDTLGTNTVVRNDLSSNGGSRTINLYTTQCGIGTARINWDRPEANFIRLILTEDHTGGASVSVTSVAATITARW